MQFSNLKE